MRCANGDTRTADGFHLTSVGHYKRCADLPPYEQPATPSSNPKLWHVAPGDPTHVFAPDLLKPINCHSAFRARRVVAALNAFRDIVRDGSAGETTAPIPRETLQKAYAQGFLDGERYAARGAAEPRADDKKI